jgi:hypothetical protein
MADANCKIHGTPMSGIGNFTFCNACDALEEENKQQAEYEAEKESSLADQIMDEEDDSVGYTSASCGGSIDGWGYVAVDDGDDEIANPGGPGAGMTTTNCTTPKPYAYVWYRKEPRYRDTEQITVTVGQEIMLTAPEADICRFAVILDGFWYRVLLADIPYKISNNSYITCVSRCSVDAEEYNSVGGNIYLNGMAIPATRKVP